MKSFWNIKIFLGVMLMTSLLMCAALLLILWARPAAYATDLMPGPAALTIIPAPTSTLRFVTPSLTISPSVPVGTFTPPPGILAVGAYVQIGGTNSEGLRLRAGPGLNGKPLFLGFDSEVFQVRDGPRGMDGYIWWYLTAPYGETRSGWAAQDYLTVIPSP